MTPVSPPTLHSKLPHVGLTIFSVMSALATKHNAVNLGQGFPDFDCDPKLIDAVSDAMKSGHNQYPLMAGNSSLRERMSEKTQALQGVRFDPTNEITITSGATQGILSSILAVVRAGDEVIVLEPCYDSYIPNIELAGGIAVPVHLTHGSFEPDFDTISSAITPKTRVIIVNTPHNPSGRTWSAEQWERLAEIIRFRDIFVLSDEVYEHMVFDGKLHVSAAKIDALRDRAFIISSFGKTLHVTGWKVGSVCAPTTLTTEFRKVHQYTVFTANSAMQQGIATYLNDPAAYQNLPAFYQAKRDRFAAGLASTSLRLLPCEGSYFQSASYENIAAVRDLNERECCEWMTRELGVTPIPMSAFYSSPTEQKIIRFCFAKKDDTLDLALERLEKIA